MPYIPLKARKEIELGRTPKTAGELNYFITTTIFDYLRFPEGCRAGYTDWNEVVGVLECCKLELYRKMIAKYEDKKCKENGEVYE